ncbi:lysylphosphatidylglycerol synthase domain-containing protein [Streptomyces scabiei]|uniref:lysylphosphatidylglycerol synthase domain-containing protein n=1 Tax=Streptomyces scabiei TaxID=1930 RepID=UPI00299055EB|nr:lysylphosphatidylglycerol synthase domain-containing protein [Streptomyces scabiei]
MADTQDLQADVSRSTGVLQRALTAVVLVGMAIAVVLFVRGQDWSVLASMMRSRPPGSFVMWVGLALLANAAAVLAALLAWWSMLSAVGADIEPTAGSGGFTAVGASRIFFVGQFAKYVPGKVFGFVLSVKMGQAMGIPPARTATAWLLTLVIGLLTAASAGLVAGPQLLGGSQVWLVAASVVPLAMLLVRPQLVNEAATVVARLRKRPPPALTLPARVIRRNVLVQMLSWLLGGTQLWCLAVALGAPPARSWPLCVGAFALGAAAGVFAVFTPDGLGVREVILLSALGAVLPLPAASVVAVISRLVVAVSELITGGVGLAVTEVLHRRAISRAAHSSGPVDVGTRYGQAPDG